MSFDRALDLPPWMRYVAFGVVAALIVGLTYLAMRPGQDTKATGSDDHTPTVVAPAAPSTEGAPENDTEVNQDPIAGVSVDMQLPLTDGELKVAAGQAVKFSELFVSYRYDQNANKKMSAIQAYLSKDTMVDLTGLIPTGSYATDLKTSKTVTDAKVTSVTAVLISTSTIVVNITVHTTTSATGHDAYEGNHVYQATLAKEDRAGTWFVREFAPADGHIDSDSE